MIFYLVRKGTPPMGRHGLHAAPRSGGKRRTAVRTGLLGVSVAVALGAAAVTTGFVPVGSSFPYVGVDSRDGSARTGAEAGSSPSSDGAPDRQGGLANLNGRTSAGTGTGASPSGTPSASPTPSDTPSPSASESATASAAPSAPSAPSAPAPAPSEPSGPPAAAPVPAPAPSGAAPSARVPEKTAAPAPAKPAPAKPTPAKPAPSEPAPPAPPKPKPEPSPSASAGGDRSAEEAAVVALVNQERAMAGCGPVRANPPLAALAGAFSKDMAVRGFFDHTDPDGKTPWDRAAQAGIAGLGGENIARGQGDAASVMNAWMNSPGHKANILNCEFRTLGVGVHFAAGGPWWTQDFGF